MKQIKLLILALLACLLGLFAVACNQTIEFDYNIDFVVDGEVIATVGTDGDKIAMPKNPTKENYTFDGWYWDEGEWDDEFTLNSILDQPLQEENHFKVYAKWKSSVYYTVIFYNAYGAYEEITQQIKYGEPTALRLNTFKNDNVNCVFDGWRNGDNIYQDGEVVLNLSEVGEEIRLSAEWKYVAPPIDYGSYTVVFDANGGEGVMANQITKRNEYVALSANVFSREFYTFIAWNTRADGTGQQYADVEEVYNLTYRDSIIILYAQWEVYGATYFIDEACDLQNIKNDLGGTYILTKDIDCIDVALTGFPFGTSDKPFNGTFDGKGFVLKNLDLTSNSIFGWVEVEGVIKNLGLELVYITQEDNECATFAIENKGTIENCYVLSGCVEASDGGQSIAVGSAGLVMTNYGTIQNCYYAGGLIMKISNGEHMGSAGICFWNEGLIKNCFADVYVQMQNDGAMVGKIDALIAHMGTYTEGAKSENNHFVLNSVVITQYDLQPGPAEDPLSVYTITTFYGKDMSEKQYVKSFYVNTLGWSENIWDFSKVNYNYGEYPILKEQQ